MMDVLKKTREVLEVLVVGSIVTASNQTQLNREISVDTILRFQAFLESGSALVLFIGVITNLLAIYYSARNDDLLLSVRLILTGENVQRLVYTILEMMNQLCTVFSNTGCARGGIAGLLFYKYPSLFVVNAFCQMFVSFSRFMTISFDGMLFQYTTKHTLLQILICYSIAISLFCVSVFANSVIVNIYVTPTLTYFMITMDLFAFLKLRKLSNSKVSMAERRLMVQMIGNSTFFSSNYFLSSLITIAQYPFFGYYLSTVALQVNSNVFTCIYTFGLSYLNMVYLKKKLSSSSEKGKYNNSASPQSVKSTMVTKTKSSN